MNFLSRGTDRAANAGPTHRPAFTYRPLLFPKTLTRPKANGIEVLGEVRAGGKAPKK